MRSGSQASMLLVIPDTQSQQQVCPNQRSSARVPTTVVDRYHGKDSGYACLHSPLAPFCRRLEHGPCTAEHWCSCPITSSLVFLRPAPATLSPGAVSRYRSSNDAVLPSIPPRFSSPISGRQRFVTKGPIVCQT